MITHKIKNRKGEVFEVLLDDGDSWLLNFKWYCVKIGNVFYAQRSYKVEKKWIPVLMHRDIIAPIPGYIIDHINRNGLDNRRENLRFCTISQNAMNKRKEVRKGTRACKSIYKGVCWYEHLNKWGAGLQVNNRRKHLGCFCNEVDAAKAYDTAARKYFGEFALTNF